MTLLAADRQWIEERARDAGFDLAGVASVPGPDSPETSEVDRRFASWVAAGHAGEMEYLQRADAAGNLLRGDLRRSMPWARSVMVCAINYNAAGADGQSAPRSVDPAPPGSGWIARYAWSGHKESDRCQGSDYHDVLLPKLRAVEAQLHARFPACTTRCYVDTGPLLERGYAARAGVGWIGKNTCVINQQQGSWLLLGVIVTSLELGPEAWSVLAADRCGSCTRCIDACPTDALLATADPRAPRQMDATRCIAYLTIEKTGSIAAELRAPMGRQVFGCDICQEVCPWNRKAPVAPTNALQPRPELINPGLAWLASLDSPGFTRIFRGSPVERTRRQTSRRRLFRRNIAIAMGNSGQRAFLPQLEAWAKSDDPVLAEAAVWAAARLSVRGQANAAK
jgi:epoxyqueuosine reductase